MALASLCQAFSTMSKAQKQLSQTGILFKTPSGYVQQSPLFSMVNQSAELVTKLCREFAAIQPLAGQEQPNEGAAEKPKRTLKAGKPGKKAKPVAKKARSKRPATKLRIAATRRPR